MFKDDNDILFKLESFDSDDVEAREATVEDARGRRILLKLKIWENLVRVEVASRIYRSHRARVRRLADPGRIPTPLSQLHHRDAKAHAR